MVLLNDGHDENVVNYELLIIHYVHEKYDFNHHHWKVLHVYEKNEALHVHENDYVSEILHNYDHDNLVTHDYNGNDMVINDKDDNNHVLH